MTTHSTDSSSELDEHKDCTFDSDTGKELTHRSTRVIAVIEPDNLDKILNDVEWRFGERKISQNEAKERLTRLITKQCIAELEVVKQRLPSPENNVEEWKGHNLGLSQAISAVDSEIDRLAQLRLEGKTG